MAKQNGTWARWACGIGVSILMAALVALTSITLANSNGLAASAARLDAQANQLERIEDKVDRLLELQKGR